MKRYCIQCGSPTDFSLKKPIYCSNCGSPFEKTAQLKKTSTILTHKKIEPILDEDDYEPETAESTGDFNIENIEVDVDIPKIKKESIRSIIGTEKPEKRSYKKNKDTKPKIKAISTKDFLSEFSKEAGSIRKKK